MHKKYKLGFDIKSLMLALAVIAPILYWIFIQAPNDVLRTVWNSPILIAVSTAMGLIVLLVLMLLCVMPCIIFGWYGANRRNIPAAAASIIWGIYQLFCVILVG